MSSVGLSMVVVLDSTSIWQYDAHTGTSFASPPFRVYDQNVVDFDILQWINWKTLELWIYLLLISQYIAIPQVSLQILHK